MIDLKWIKLESGHGKGIPDEIDATVQKAIKCFLLYNPDRPIYSASFKQSAGSCTIYLVARLFCRRFPNVKFFFVTYR